ncbi:Protein timeless [Fasciola gigantica]|uniref:Protein timeless n=1 Tax=Fasciola gigantica TaxID=46835 RepID=A0A504YJD3_FASGI|nr:Protein timeless [Fasciola gigantica]
MISDRVLRFADIQACCACLGFREGPVYKIDSDAEASVRSLLRYLRNEGSDCDVRLELGRLRIVSSDLIPLLRSCGENKTLMELVIRLLMNLTQPAIVCFRQELPKDRDLYGTYVQLDDLLKSYKKKWEERSEDDRLLIERILILVRNVLHIGPDKSEEATTDDNVSVHDQLLWAMHLSGWDELLLFLGNAEDEQMFIFHTLEIISLMLREQTPETLASAGSSNPSTVKMDELAERQRAVEEADKRKFLFDRGSRQNRFGGTFELWNTASLSDRPLIYHHDVTQQAVTNQPPAETKSQGHVSELEGRLEMVDLDKDKRTFRKARNRKPVIDRPLHHRSILAIRLYLQRFCWNFLQFCYNPLMHAAKASLTRHATQENDETYYLWAVHFFLAFSRLYRFRSSLIREYLRKLIEGAHLFISMLSDRTKSGTKTMFVRRKRVVRRAHRKHRTNLSKTGRKKKDQDAVEEEDNEVRMLRIEYQWKNQLLPELVRILENPNIDQTGTEDDNQSSESDDHEASRLFDAVSGGSEAKQLRSAIHRVQANLYAGRAVVALRLARRMWRLWPEVVPVTVDENDPVLNDELIVRLPPASVPILSALRQIHITELQEEEEEEDEHATNGGKSDSEEDAEVDDDLYNEELGVAGSDEEGVLVTLEKEVQMDLTSFVLKFANPKIVQALTSSLAEFATNPNSTNLAIVHLIHRLAVKHKMIGSFFQLRLFYVFQQFLHNKTLAKSSEFKELANLVKYTLRKFFSALENNSGLFIEVLFPKNVREGFEVSQGYGTFEDSKKTSQWNSELDEELIKLFEAYRNDPVPQGLDLVDVISQQLSDQTKTRRQIMARLICLDIITSAKQLKQITVRDKRPKRSVRRMNEDDSAEWTEGEVMRLRSAVDEHQGSKKSSNEVGTGSATGSLEPNLYYRCASRHLVFPINRQQTTIRLDLPHVLGMIGSEDPPSSDEADKNDLTIRTLKLDDSNLPVRHRVQFSDSESDSEPEKPLTIVTSHGNDPAESEEQLFEVTTSSLPAVNTRHRLDSELSEDEQSGSHLDTSSNKQSLKRRLVVSSDSDE